MSVHVGGRGPGHLARVMGGAWTPSQLGSALKGEWDAERSDLITTVGAAVSSFRDTVAGYDATQGVGAARPIYSATSFNGRPGLTFDGLDDELTYAGVGAFPVGANPGEIWLLTNQTALAADATARVAFGYGDTFATRRSVDRSVVAGVNRGRGSNTGTTNNNVAVELSGINIMRLRVGASSYSIDVNGISDGTSTSVVPNTATTRTRIGALPASSSSAFYQGAINWVGVTDPLSNEQAAQLLQFLKTRGGIA